MMSTVRTCWDLEYLEFSASFAHDRLHWSSITLRRLGSTTSKSQYSHVSFDLELDTRSLEGASLAARHPKKKW